MERPIPSYKCIPVLHFFFLSFYTLSPIPLHSSIHFLVRLPLQIFCSPVRSLQLPPAIQDMDLLHWDSQHLNVPRMHLPPLRHLSTNKSPTASPAVSDASTAFPPSQPFAYTPTFRFILYPLLLFTTPADSPAHTSTFLRRIAPFTANRLFFRPFVYPSPLLL